MGHGIKNSVRDTKLVVRALLPSHIGKPVWVAQAIAAGELCVLPP